MGGVGSDRVGASGALGSGARGARVLGDRDAREGSREEEGQMHVELSIKRCCGKGDCHDCGWKKNDRF